MDDGQDLLDEFLLRAETEPAKWYSRVLTTLEVNKLEVDYQKPGFPVIYRKEFDDLGLVVSVTRNPLFADEVPLPRTEFTREEYLTFLDGLLEDATSDAGMKALMSFGHIEKEMTRTLGERYFETLSQGPFIEKRYDDDTGMPSAYCLSSNVSIKQLL